MAAPQKKHSSRRRAHQIVLRTAFEDAFVQARKISRRAFAGTWIARMGKAICSVKANGHGSRSPKAAPKQPGGDFGVRTCSAGEARAGTSLHTQPHSGSRGGEAAWHQQGCGRTSSPSPSIKSWDIWARRKQRGEKKQITRPQKCSSPQCFA